MKIQLNFKPMKGIGGGFRMDWISAEVSKKLSAGLDSGAGVGNPLLTYWVKRNGKTEYYTADMADVLRELIRQSQEG